MNDSTSRGGPPASRLAAGKQLISFAEPSRHWQKSVQAKPALPAVLQQSPVAPHVAAALNAGRSLQLKPGAPRTIQRAAASRSGRSPQTLWTHFSKYCKSQAETVTHAFLAAGYTVDTAMPAILGAIATLALDLPAHGTGNSDSGTQGNLQEEAADWVSKLTQYASEHPAGAAAAAPARGKKHTPAQAAAAAKKKVADRSKAKAAKASAFKEEARAACHHPAESVIEGYCMLCGNAV